MKGTLANGAHGGSADAVAQDRCTDAMTGAERGLGGVLADVLRVDDLSVESHFFDELGADSLVMAKFCARVRKRVDLPSVSMQDIYGHPTIRSLAAALSARAVRPAQPLVFTPMEAATPTSTREYIFCGALQAIFFLAYTYLLVVGITGGYQWVSTGSGAIEICWRLLLASNAAFLVFCAAPIAAKWMLIGRWKPQKIRIWSLGYVRFWIVKTLIRSNPVIHLLIGSPLYPLYLRALGAKVGRGAVILSRSIPVCTDLLTIGAGAVLRRDASFNCYRAQAGRIEIGPVTIGSDAYVGETAVLDIDTSMGDGAQLGHSSALLSGQSVPAGARWHGSPAQRTETNFVRVPPARCSTLRRAVAGGLTLTGILLVWAPLLQAGFSLLFLGVSALVARLDPGVHSSTGALTGRGLFIEALAFSAVLFFGMVLVSLLAVGIVPRLLRRFIQPDKVYPLYGFRYMVHRVVSGLGRLEFLPMLFGDSSFIVHYLEWLGCHLKPVEQTGSNFGSEVKTSNPFLTSVGRGTMIADGLSIVNEEVSSTSFRVCRVAIGPRNFFGNDISYPAGGRTGDNCLLGIKVMVPLDGKVREGVGLLGSPPFEIPRSVERDSQFDHLHTGEAMRRGLAAKNRFNLGTVGIFLFTRWLGLFLITMINLAALEFFYDVWAHTVIAGLFALSAVLGAVYYALVEGIFEKLSPPPPAICSIYDPRFWWVERIWKLHPIHFLKIFDGTPFKNLLWRLIGVRIGKRVFDDGVYISEPTLTAVGDECVFNQQSKIQCDSQEDGTYKSGRATLGAGCTLGVAALIHYDVTMGDGSVLAADSFLMKGEDVPAHARWGGNPAREI